MNLKKCLDCGETKKESNFRYIKYFRKHCRICKRCEAKEKARKRRGVQAHIKKHGVTQRVLNELQWEATYRVNKIERDKEASKFPDGQFERLQNRYHLLSSISLVVSFFSFLAFFWFLFIGSSAWAFGTILIFCISLAFDKLYCQARIYEYPDSRDNPLWETFLQEEIQKRRQYERFYISQEWRIVRTEFLKKQKKINGYYVCKLCDKPICGPDFNLTVDHQKPRSKYPELALDINNLAVAHRSCNSSKGAKEFD